MSRHLFNNSAQYHEGATKSQYTAKVTTETTEKETETVTPTAPRSANMYVGDVLDNQLDALNSPSYNIKLYMIGAGSKSTSTGTENTTSPDSDNSNSDDQRQNQSTATTQLSGGGYLNDAIRAEPGQTVVLAQTGVTEVGIDNVELVTVPGGVSGSEASTLNFTITQPNAADFPDQIIKARAFLGIPLDATDAPLFVEINFTGYSEAEGEGSQDGEGSGKPVNIGPYIYPVHLKNFNMSINTGGSTYDFETVVKDDLYTADVFFRLKKMFTTTGASIYDHLLDLQTQVNDHNGKNNAEERIDFGLDDATKTVPGLDIKDQTLDIGLGVETAAKSKNPVIAAATDVLEAITIVKDVGVLEQKENETEAELTARQAASDANARAARDSELLNEQYRQVKEILDATISLQINKDTNEVTQETSLSDKALEDALAIVTQKLEDVNTQVTAAEVKKEGEEESDYNYNLRMAPLIEEQTRIQAEANQLIRLDLENKIDKDKAASSSQYFYGWERLADNIEKLATLNETGNTANTALGIVDARASGGPTNANETYLVGEEGPELFSSNMAGLITSTQDTSAMLESTLASINLLNTVGPLLNSYVKNIDVTSSLLSDAIEEEKTTTTSKGTQSTFNDIDPITQSLETNSKFLSELAVRLDYLLAATADTNSLLGKISLNTLNG